MTDPGPCPTGAGKPEYREAGNVRCGREQGEVGGDLELAVDASAAAAVAAAHEVADLPLDFRAGGLVSAFQAGSCWRVRAAARRASCGPMVIVAVVHCAASGQRSSPAGRAEPCAARD